MLSVDAGAVDAAVVDALGRVAESLHADSARVFRRSAGAFRCTHEWAASGGEPALPPERDLEAFGWLPEDLPHADRPVLARSGGALREGPEPGERAVQEGWRGIAFVPVRAGGGLEGVLTFGWRGRDPEIHDEQLGPLSVLGDVVVGTVDRVRAEQALRESEERYRLLFEGARDAVILVDLETLHAIDANPAARELYGYATEEFLGTHADAITAEPDASREVVERARRGEAVQVPLRWHRRKDGTTFPVELSTNVIELGDRKVMVAIGRDMSRRVEAERSLRDSEAALEAAQHLASVGSWIHEPGTGRHLWSDELYRIHGLDPATTELTLTTGLEHVHPDDRERVEELFSRSSEHRGPCQAQYRIVRPDGTERVVVAASSWELDPAGHPLRNLGTVQDVTERVRLEEQLRHAQKMEAVGRLAGGIAHDFNNLLTAITGYTTLLLAETPEDDARRSDLIEIEAAAHRASDLVGQLLTFSRRRDPSSEPHDLNEIVRSVEGMLRRVIGEDVVLSTQLHLVGDAVPAEPGELEQLLLNLAVNARDAMPEGGRLTITTSQCDLGERAAEQLGVAPGRYAVLEVADTGTGMDEETRAHIFEPFFTTKEPGKGTGLGLSTVYAIATRSGGAVEASSEPGRGSTFRAYLPRVPAGGRALPTRPERAARPGRSERVLVVEDDVAVRALVRQVLERHGFRVLVAADGDEAERIARREPVDLLVSDVVLPGRRGPELAEALRARRPGLPVVLMSGYLGEAAGLPEDLASDGGLLAKPFRPEELVARVLEALDRAGR
ncbi:MAG: PAS domain S-box protein [Acidimicrobiia bacterium]|nr:PAS domain S-box protein [Acidimicrobiia bacterium]